MTEDTIENDEQLKDVLEEAGSDLEDVANNIDDDDSEPIEELELVIVKLQEAVKYLQKQAN